MSKIRCRYKKIGKARYISHLDLMATMQRAFLRAGVKLKYSEGFNPHPYMSVALPLPVGNESLCELIDIELESGELPCDIGSLLPEGLEILDTYLPSRKFKAIKWIEVNCRLHYGEIPNEASLRKLYNHLTGISLVIQKKTKKETKMVDISPFIRDVVLDGNSVIELSAKISAQNPTINQNDLHEAIRCNEEIAVPYVIEIKRIELYDEDMVLFK